MPQRNRCKMRMARSAKFNGVTLPYCVGPLLGGGREP